MAVFVKSCLAKSGGTWASIWAILVWSLNCLFAGAHPATQHDGQPWPKGSFGARQAGRPLVPGGFFGVVHRIQGDLDWFNNSLKMRLSPMSNAPCAWCEGNRSTRPFLHLAPDAAWVRTIKKPPEGAPSDHPIWGLAGVGLFS
eukprot:2875502-Alexandrium_andersonii.AAC.1